MTRDCEIVNALRIERRARRMSLREVGRRLDVCGCTVSHWESGNHQPSARDLERWCGALGLRLALEPAVETTAYRG